MLTSGDLRTPVRFTLDDAHHAADEWGANCGPGAIAAICGMTLDELRPYLGNFERTAVDPRKRYTNPTLMWQILKNLKVTYEAFSKGTVGWNLREQLWPTYGLARVQWEGKWTEPGVPMRVRYRHTHWVGSVLTTTGLMIFDINCIGVGGWVDAEEWAWQVVPWLLKETQPKANGKWHLTHMVEVLSRPKGYQHG